MSPTQEVLAPVVLLGLHLTGQPGRLAVGVLAAPAAVASRGDAAFSVTRWLVLAAVGYGIVSLFVRRIGGPDGGSEKRIVGVGALAAAIVVGVLVATRR